MVVRPERLELPTLCSEGRCSIRLSYERLGVFYGKIAIGSQEMGGREWGWRNYV